MGRFLIKRKRAQYPFETKVIKTIILISSLPKSDLERYFSGPLRRNYNLLEQSIRLKKFLKTSILKNPDFLKILNNAPDWFSQKRSEIACDMCLAKPSLVQLAFSTKTFSTTQTFLVLLPVLMVYAHF